MSAVILAPGKLVLVGEYAVLDGGPAVVQAITRGVRCDLTLANARRGEDAVEITTPDDDDRFVAPALQGAAAGHYRFSAWNPVAVPGKAGFGSSAAACVAACLAAGRPATDAIAIHRAVQGSGSGVDVAASLAGGTLRFQSGQTQAAQAPMPVVVYSGRSAHTGPRLLAYRAWARASPDHAAFLRRSAMLVPTLQADPIATAREGLRILVDMAAAARFTYLTPGLTRIIALAEAHGGGAKPSGAGGGDIAIAWLPDPQAQADFIAACRAEDLPPIEVQPAPGARRLDDGILKVPSPR